MKIGIITYKESHLKTQIVSNNLINKGHEVIFFFIKFEKRKKRKILFEHRPAQKTKLNNKEFANLKKIKIFNFRKINENKLDHLIITLGNYIDVNFVKKKIVN